MAREFPMDSGRIPRRTVTYRSQSSVYYGFTEFGIDQPRPHAAGIFMLAEETVGPDIWRILLVGETADFTAGIKHNTAGREARRRGASRILLHFSPLGSQARLNAAQDLWLAIRSPLVSWATAPLHRFG